MPIKMFMKKKVYLKTFFVLFVYILHNANKKVWDMMNDYLGPKNISHVWFVHFVTNAPCLLFQIICMFCS